LAYVDLKTDSVLEGSRVPTLPPRRVQLPLR